MRFYTDLAITAQGTKFANPNQGEATVTITNLEKSVRDFILTETTPFNRNRTPKRLTLEAGRVSTGLSLLYTGNIFRATVTQQPDQTVSIKCLTGQFMKQQIVANSLPGNVSLSRVAAMVAADASLRLVFEAADKNIADYNFTGAVIKQVEKLGQAGGVDAFVDNDNLIIKNIRQALRGRLRVLTPRTGLIGLPEPTEQGIKVNMLYDQQTVIGGALDLTSDVYPALSGRYVIYKLGYNLSNRDTPFYLNADARRAM